MRRLLAAVVIACTAALVGCSDNSTAPRDVTPPASPQGLYSVTGDRTVTLRWIANTEPDLAGYRIYQAACASGPDCPYTRIAVATTNQYVLTGLTNGIKRYYAVTAVDHAGNESALSAGDVFDTPRPAGTNALLGNALEATATAGWRFATAGVVASTDPTCDVYFGHNGSIAEMFANDVQTDIQDAGYSTTLDHVDYAPPSGWSPTGSVELIVGHCYVVWTRDDHYAKFRVTAVDVHHVTFDWAYQTAVGDPELRARRARGEGWPARREPVWLRSALTTAARASRSTRWGRER